MHIPAVLTDGTELDLATGGPPSDAPLFADPLYSRWTKVTEWFVTGSVIEHLGPAGSSNFYGSRLIAGANGGMTACSTGSIGTTTDTTGSNTSTTASTVTTTTGHAVAGVQTPPSTGAVGIVTPIVALPGGSNQLPPSSVQSVQTAPVVAVRGLPSTSTDSAPTIPFAALGLALMGVGGVLLRRRDTRV